MVKNYPSFDSQIESEAVFYSKMKSEVSIRWRFGSIFDFFRDFLVKWSHLWTKDQKNLSE